MADVPQIVVMLILDNGRIPLQEWLSGFRNRVTTFRIQARIDRIERGDFGVSKRLGDGVSELKLDIGPGYRVYYGRIGTTTVILLGGSDKSDQAGAIQRAVRLWKQFEEDGMPGSRQAPWPPEERL